MKYNLDDIHWQEFEVFAFRCLQIMVSPSIQFIEGGGDKGRDIIYTGNSIEFEPTWRGKWIIQSKHKSIRGVGERKALDNLLADLKPELQKVFVKNNLPCDNYILVTNLTVPGEFFDKANEQFTAFCAENSLANKNFYIIGYRHLESIIDRQTDIKWGFPAIISHPDFQILINDALNTIIKARNLGWFKSILKNRDYFVRTKIASDALSKIDTHHIILLSGPPKSGKTFNAEMVALYYVGTGDFEAIRIDDPEEIEKFYNPSRKQIFVCDDAFGAHGLSYGSAEEWDRKLEDIFFLADENHKFVFTSREHIFRAFKNYAKSFSEDYLNYILVEYFALSDGEKLAILNKYVTLSSFDVDTKAQILKIERTILRHQNFSPETIRSFFTNTVNLTKNIEEILKALSKHLDKPDEYLSNLFFNLEDPRKAFLISILCGLERGIDEVGKTYTNLIKDLNISGITSYQRELEELEGGIVRLNKNSVIEEVSFYHPSMQEFLISLIEKETSGIIRSSALKNSNLTLLEQFYLKSPNIKLSVLERKFLIGLKIHDIKDIGIGFLRLVENSNVKIFHILRIFQWFTSQDISLSKILDRPLFSEIKDVADMLISTINKHKFYDKFRDESASRWSELIGHMKHIDMNFGTRITAKSITYSIHIVIDKKNDKDFWKIALRIISLPESDLVLNTIGQNWLEEFCEELKVEIFNLGYEIFGSDFPEFKLHSKNRMASKITEKPNRNWYPRFVVCKDKIRLLKEIRSKVTIVRDKINEFSQPYNEIVKQSDYARQRHLFIVSKGWWKK